MEMLLIFVGLIMTILNKKQNTKEGKTFKGGDVISLTPYSGKTKSKKCQVRTAVQGNSGKKSRDQNKIYPDLQNS